MQNKLNLLIIPGAGCSIDFYNNIIKDFNEYFNTKVISYEGNTLEECEDSLIKKISIIDNRNFVILGHCLGGAIVTRAIEKHKFNCLKGLILCSSVVNFRVFKKSFYDKNNEEHNDFYIKDNINADRVLEAKKHLLPLDILKTHLSISFDIDNTDILKKIDIPKLILCSDKDGFFNYKDFLDTINCCENGTILSNISNARHLVLVTHTKYCIKKILNWLKVENLLKGKINYDCIL